MTGTYYGRCGLGVGAGGLDQIAERKELVGYAHD